MQKPQLFLLHFAGGSAYSFQSLLPLLKQFDVYCLELPGRGKRIGERCLLDFSPAAKDIFNQIRVRLTSAPFLIYGHSMGAYLALRVTNMLEESDRLPVCVIVSGNAGPGVEDDKKRHLLGHDEFIQEIRRIGGVPEELLENRELFDFFEPVLRADFEIVETVELAGERPVNAPLFAMMGDKEEKVDQITNWANYAGISFRYEILVGDHFFIYKHPYRVAAIIKECYGKCVLNLFR